jgi:signal transduction histidine kinase
MNNLRFNTVKTVNPGLSIPELCCKVPHNRQPESSEIGMFKLLRFYSVTSFVIIFAAAALLTLFYRHVTIRWIDHLAKTNNLAVAQTALSSVGPELGAYLAAVTGAGKDKTASRKLPDEVSTHLFRMTQNTSVGSIRIYTRDGAVAFSTLDEPVSADHGADPGFQSAMRGEVFSSMVFRDMLGRLFAASSAEDNRMLTFTPIRSGPGTPVLGVFETRTDMSHLVEESDRVLLFFLAGAELILALLYAMLLFVVRHARNILHIQHKTIRERTATLEILSKSLLNGEELKKKKIAADLHEGLAQTLSAIKINMESTELAKACGEDSQPLESIVPVLQSAIHEVRTIATQLRPSSLDDLGLLPTLNWFCREFEHQHPDIRIQKEIFLREGTIPSHLKIDIYRIIESAFKNIAKYSNTDQIRFVMHLADDMIHLIIGDTPTIRPAITHISPTDPAADPQFRFAEMKERTSLSGGVFSSTLERMGGVTLRASWACGD